MPAGAHGEETWISPQPRSGGIKVAVVYPNAYPVGMSNLGFQTVLRAFLEDGRFDARRAFWERGSLSFPDGGRYLDEFDVVALSVSYQPDLVHLPRLLEAGRAGNAAGGAGPLILGGGVALTINPEPAAPFFDALVLGDAEPVLPTVMDALLPGGRPDPEGFPDRVAGLPGVYLPARYAWEHGPGNGLGRPRPLEGGAPEITTSLLGDLDAGPARPAVISQASEFGDLYLLEISRGCPAGCLFCAAGAVCGPVRFLGMEAFAREADLGLRYRSRIGLVGTAVSYHPDLEAMGRMLTDRGGGFSPSSIRAETVTEGLAGLLVRSGHRTVSLAPEAGTDALRRSIGKGLADRQILEKADLLFEAGIPNLKLYFMVGLPGETDGDVAGIAALVEELRETMIRRARPRGRMGSITVSVNPFVPKPRTAFERAPVAGEEVLTRRLGILRDRLGPVGSVRVQTGSVRGAYLDALLSLGDRRVAAALDKLPAGGVSLRRLTKILPSAERILFGRGEGDLPWKFIK